MYLKGGKVKMTDTGVSVDTGDKAYTFSALKAAVDLGVPLKCSYQVDGNSYEGYVKGKQWRGMMSMADGKVGEVIVKDNCSWSWQQGDSQGSKYCFEPTEPVEGEETPGDVWEQTEDEENPVEYHCEPALVTDDKFTPPANIQFADMNQVMNQMQDQVNQQVKDAMKQLPQAPQE